MTSGTPCAIEIGGGVVELRTHSPTMRDRIFERYGEFVRESERVSSVDMRIELSVDADARPAGVHATWVDQPPVEADGDLDHLHVRAPGFEAEFDFAAGTAHARIPDALAYADLCLRIALGITLLRRGDCLLHAAAVVRDRWGVVFSGPSGAGKSTIARICRERGSQVLADEMVVARHVGVGTRVCGSPIWHGADASAPAGAIFFLEHTARPDDEATVTPIAPTLALPRLLAAGGAPVDTPAVQEAFFESAARVLKRIPVYRLAFGLQRDFWPAIDALPEFRFFRPRVAPSRSATPPIALRPAPTTAAQPLLRLHSVSRKRD